MTVTPRSKSLASAGGFTLVEFLFYLAILGLLSAGIYSSTNYFLSKYREINAQSNSSLTSEYLNKLLASKLEGITAITQVSSGNSADYCYELQSKTPVGFNTLEFSPSDNPSVFQLAYKDNSPSDSLNAKLSKDQLGYDGNSFRKLSLSTWVNFLTSDNNLNYISQGNANIKNFFEFKPLDPNLSGYYKIAISLTNTTTLRVDLGLGVVYEFNVGKSMTDGGWHHLVVIIDPENNSRLVPKVYVDKMQLAATLNSAVNPLIPSNPGGKNYQITIGQQDLSNFSVGPFGIWGRVLKDDSTNNEIEKLFDFNEVAKDSNTIWVDRPVVTMGSITGNVKNGLSVTGFANKSYLYFKNIDSKNNQSSFGVYYLPQANGCFDPKPANASVKPGAVLLTDQRCNVPAANQAPLAANSGDSFSWTCAPDSSSSNVKNSNQQFAKSQISNVDAACTLDVKKEDFKIDSQTSDTAFIIVEGYDPNLDDLSMVGVSFGDLNRNYPPDITPRINGVDNPAFNFNTPPANFLGLDIMSSDRRALIPLDNSNPYRDTVSSIRWYQDPGRKVGMLRIISAVDRTTNLPVKQDKVWWVNNIFNNLKYVSKSLNFNYKRKIIFSIGDKWPVKSCDALGYKSAYHFYEAVKDNPGKNFAEVYADAISDGKKYMNMRGYLANVRCGYEDSQITKWILAGNRDRYMMGAWVTWQSANDLKSLPDFSTSPDDFTAIGAATYAQATNNPRSFFSPGYLGSFPSWLETPFSPGVYSSWYETIDLKLDRSKYTGPWNSPNFPNPDSNGILRFTNDPPRYDVTNAAMKTDFENAIQRFKDTSNARKVSDDYLLRYSNDGSVQWRWVGGPTVDNNVIFHTDGTNCNDLSKQASFLNTDLELRKRGCAWNGGNFSSLVTPSTAATRDCSNAPNSAFCTVKNQSGGSRQFAKFTSASPSESSPIIVLGGGASSNDYLNQWAEETLSQYGGDLSRIVTKPRDASGYGIYYLVEYGDHPSDPLNRDIKNQNKFDLDPPNMVTKTVDSVKALYCKR